MYKNYFQFKFCCLDNATVIAKVKNINVAFCVVKKLPEVLKGKTSIKKRNIKGVIVLLYFKTEDKKYFLTKER